MIRLLPLGLIACTVPTSPQSTETTKIVGATAIIEARQTSPLGDADRVFAEGGRVWSVNAATLAHAVAAPAERPRIYNFWATWCAPCIAEMPTLVAYGSAHPEVELWFVDTDHPKFVGPKVDKVRVEQHLNAFLHLQPAADELDILAALEPPPAALPTTWVVTPSGERVATLMGAVSAAQLDEAVAKAR